MDGKKKKIRLMTHALMLISFIFLFVCVETSSAQSGPMTLKVGIKNPPTDVQSVAIKHFTDQVEKKTKGRIKFQFFYNETLLTATQFVDGVGMGIADISTGPVSYITGKQPELSILETFGAIPQDKWKEVFQAIYPVTSKSFQKVNVHQLMTLYVGTSIFSGRKEFLKSPEQWKGKRVRMGGKWQSILANKWGASPVFLPPSELYLALQRGTLDGYFLVYSIIGALKLYEVAPYVVETGFSSNIEFVTMNLKKWESLSPEDKKIFEEAAAETSLFYYPKELEFEKGVRDSMIKSGAKVYDLSKSEQQEFLKHAYQIWPDVRKVSGPMGNQLIDILEKFK